MTKTIAKWGFLGTGALIVLSMVMSNSYVQTSIGMLSDSVQDSVPVDFEIERLRTLVAQIEPEIAKNKHAIANEEVQIRLLDRKIDKLEGNVTKQEGEIKQLASDLGTGMRSFTYSNVSFTKGEVEKDLKGRFERFKIEKETIASMRSIQSARQKTLNAAKTKIKEMVSMKLELSARIAQLKQQMKLNEIANVKSEFAFDDSVIGQAKKLSEEIRVRLEVESATLNGSLEASSNIVLELESDGSSKDVLGSVTEYFQEKNKIDVETLVVN